MKKQNKILATLFSITLFLIIILGSINVMVFNKEFYYSQYEKNGAYDKLGNDLPKNITTNILKYFHGNTELEYLTEPEKNHMLDVKSIIFTASTIYYSAIILMMILFVVCYKLYKNNNYLFTKIISNSMIYGAIASLIFLIVIFIYAISGFDSFFYSFHEIFFPQGNWMFDSSSLLITLFPEQFFIEISLRIFIYAIIQSLIFLGVGYYIKKKIHIFEKHYPKFDKKTE